MPDLLSSFLKFATFGVTSEIVFTALVTSFNAVRAKQKIDWSLYGYSYIWMVPIYGSIAFLGPLIIEPLQALPLLARLLIYTAVIFVVEYVTGWIIRKMTGRCPWHYDKGWQIHNLIRLDFTPSWMFFSWLVEFLYFNY
jgi:uncharacterized membrane protein